jgi:hypothetical protein
VRTSVAGIPAGRSSGAGEPIAAAAARANSPAEAWRSAGRVAIAFAITAFKASSRPGPGSDGRSSCRCAHAVATVPWPEKAGRAASMK